MTETQATLDPVVKEITVRCSPERAFEAFTEEMGSWWPLASHSVGGDEAEDVVIEGRVGGRILERISDGREAVWGTILAWDPPRRFASTWHPGTDEASQTEIEVSFHSEGAGTRVRLEHRGWERRSEEARAAYQTGWDPVLARFVESFT